MYLTYGTAVVLRVGLLVYCRQNFAHIAGLQKPKRFDIFVEFGSVPTKNSTLGYSMILSSSTVQCTELFDF